MARWRRLSKRRITMRNFHGMLIAASAFAAMGGPAAAKQDEPLACSVNAPNVSCVMKDLDNPRGLAFGPHGTLFVAEAGTGNAPCRPGTRFNCYEHTVAITRLWRGEQIRVASGFASLSFVLGASARGPHDIVMWRGKGGPPSMPGGGGAIGSLGLEKTATARNAPGRGGLRRLAPIPIDTLLAPSPPPWPDRWDAVGDNAASP